MSTASRICAEPGCPEFAVDRGRCERHRRSTTGRGYGQEHQAARRALEATLPRFCAYGCGTWLTVGGRWVAAHVVDGDPSAGWVVACGPCNERAKRTGSARPDVDHRDRVQTENWGRRSFGRVERSRSDPTPPGARRVVVR